MKSVMLISLLLVTVTIASSQPLNWHNIRLLPLEINSSLNDFAPVYYKEGIVFVRENEEELYRLFYSPNRFDRHLHPVEFNLSSRKVHYGPATFKPSENILIYSSNTLNKEEGFYRLQLFSSYKSENGWSEGIPLEFCDPSYNYTHPFMSPDGRKLFFVSDMPGGYGGMDIYSTTAYDTAWSVPENLGGNVNTAGHDIFPTIPVVDRIFFSRKSENRGMDIHQAEYIDDSWRYISVLSLPINSDDDDFHLIYDPRTRSGYFSSNRISKNDNIFKFRYGADSGDEESGLIFFTDSLSGKPLMEIEVIAIPLNKNGMIKLEDSYSSSIFLNDKGELQIKVNFDEGLKQNLPRYKTGKDGSVYLPYAHQYKLLADHEDYNHQLYEAMIGDTVELSVIACDTVTINFYNEENQLLENTSLELPQCVKQLKEHKGGYDICIKNCKAAILTISHTDYHPLSIPLSDLGGFQNIHLNPLNKQPEIILEKDKTYTLEKLHFTSGISKIPEDAEEELDYWINLLEENPGMKIEISSHTDSEGDALYNLKLSLERALAVRDYLVTNGIEAIRLRAVGYGENRPLVKCSNCTEEEDQKNRRTDIKIMQL